MCILHKICVKLLPSPGHPSAAVMRPAQWGPTSPFVLRCGLLFVHTHMRLQRMEEASKELNARRLAVEMIKEQLRIPDVDTGSGLTRKEKQG